MAANGDHSMISPPSSISNGPEPSQFPPYPPPLRSGQVLQPLSVFPVNKLSSEAPYDYVFGGPLETPALSSSIKLTSPPIRLRSDADLHHKSNLDDGRHLRRSLGHAPKQKRPLAESASNASSRGHGDYDEDSLRQLLLEFA